MELTPSYNTRSHAHRDCAPTPIDLHVFFSADPTMNVLLGLVTQIQRTLRSHSVARQTDATALDRKFEEINKRFEACEGAPGTDSAEPAPSNLCGALVFVLTALAMNTSYGAWAPALIALLPSTSTNATATVSTVPAPLTSCGALALASTAPAPSTEYGAFAHVTTAFAPSTLCGLPLYLVAAVAPSTSCGAFDSNTTAFAPTPRVVLSISFAASPTSSTLSETVPFVPAPLSPSTVCAPVSSVLTPPPSILNKLLLDPTFASAYSNPTAAANVFPFPHVAL